MQRLDLATAFCLAAILTPTFFMTIPAAAEATPVTDDSLKMSIMKYKLTKENQAETELTVERTRKCASTWMYFRSLAVVTDELGKLHEDFTFKSSDWHFIHWLTAMDVMEALEGLTDTTADRAAVAQEINAWEFDTKIAWAGICYLPENKRTPYDPELSKKFAQPGDYDANGNPVEKQQ